MVEKIKTYRGYNAGFFADAHRPIKSDKPELVGHEIIIDDKLSTKLRNGEETRVLGLGERMAVSLMAIGCHHLEEITDGQLNIYATSHDRFDPEVALRVAEDRLKRFGSERGWEEAQKEALAIRGRVAWEAMFNEKPLLPDFNTLEFAQRHLSLVNYLRNVDSADLTEVLIRKKIGRLDIVHERMGGLFHHPDKRNALAGVSKALKVGGEVITYDKLDDVEYGVDSPGIFGLELVQEPNRLFAYRDYKKVTE